MNNYKFTRLSTANLHFLVGLYKECFKLHTSTEALSKKYNTLPFGKQFIGYLAFDESTGEAAGYYGVFPILCSYKSAIVLSAQSGDTMTHPNHQGKGLFTQLAKKTYELAKAEGISFVFGFPNKNSYPGFIKKLDWIHYSDINNYSIATGALPFDKIAKKNSFFNKVFQATVRRRISRYQKAENFENSIQKQCSDIGYVIHDEKFYNYKKYSHFFKIKIDNVSCVVKIDGRLWVGDIDYQNEIIFWNTVTGLQKLGKQLGCSSVQFSFCEGSHYDMWMKQKYAPKSKNPVGCLSLNADVKGTNFCYQALDFDTY